MKRLLLIPMIVTVLQGQMPDESPFEDFIVAIWPEYDHPGVLVIYTGSIKENQLPLHLQIRIPDETGVVMAAGQSDTSTVLRPVESIQNAEGKWANVILVRQQFQVEFYFDPFGESELREGSVAIEVNHPLQDYHILIQKPLAAEQFSFSEKDAEPVGDDHGLNYLRVHVPRQQGGVEKSISFSYRNPSGNLTVELLQEMLANDPSGLQSDGGSRERVVRYRLPTYEPMAVLGVLAMAIGFLFWRSDKRASRAATSGAGKNFCPKCGAKTGLGDRFCTKCGSRLT